jgi:hypothetical protein
MAGKIEKRRTFAGTGMMSSPERLEELENRRALHARLIQGKPEKTFAELLDEKLRKARGELPPEPPDREDSLGARDPHLGLSPSQDSSIAASGKGRRSGRVIVKG